MLYDGASRRISKETANIRTTFSWDGDYLLSDNIGEENYREFVYYPDSFELLAFIDKENEIFYFHNDAVGLPHEITDSENKIVWSAGYDGFGRIEKLYENKVNNPIRFQGQYYDEELDLSYNRHRYFDADTGSFISIDPLGLEAGTNLYRYAPNVWGWIDPLGFCQQDLKYTRFIYGVQIKDIRTGKILEGTVDIKPTLDRISSGKKFRHRNDGSIFQNRPARGKTTPELPVKPKGYYREFVQPTPEVSGPGPQRIVMGEGGEIYYSPDHYKTFIRANP